MIQQAINNDLKEFLKAGKSFEAGVLRLMMAAFKNKEIVKRGIAQDEKLSDEEIIDLLMKEVKKRREAAEIYKKGGREDLAEKENKETEVIKKYLPAEFPREEIEKIISEAIAAVGAKNHKDIGKTMAEASKKLKGRADMVLVSEIIKRKLNNE